MSLYKCDHCKDLVDTDDYPEGWQEHKYGDLYFCEPCNEKREAEQDKADHMCALAEDRYKAEAKHETPL